MKVRDLPDTIEGLETKIRVLTILYNYYNSDIKRNSTYKIEKIKQLMSEVNKKINICVKKIAIEELMDEFYEYEVDLICLGSENNER